MNLTGSFLVARKAGEVLEEGGSLVLTGSVAGLGAFGLAHYAAGKLGVVGLARTLALELARKGVRVNVLLPGLIQTPMTAGLPPGPGSRRSAPRPWAGREGPRRWPRPPFSSSRRRAPTSRARRSTWTGAGPSWARRACPRGLGPKEVSGMPMYFEDFEVGQRFVTAGRTVTEADVVNFAGVSGDYNPIHTDAEFAKSTPFGQRIAHGLLVLSMLTGLRQRTGATDGTLIAWLEIRNYRFLKPVLIGDTVHGETEIVEKRETSKPDRGIVVQRVRVLNQRGEVVQEGEFVTMIRRRPREEA